MPTEADTCRTYIVPKLHTAGWEDEYISEQMVLTRGRIVPIGDRHIRKEGLRPDYVLSIRQNIHIAVVEAKAEYKSPAAGLQQAIQYAEMMGLKFAYSSNGKGIVEHDFITGLERNLDAFPSPDELWGRLKGTFNFQSEKEEKDSLSDYWQEVGGKSSRYYQQVAINRAVNAVLTGQPRILITMATGTGKTFVAFQIAWRLWKAKRKKKILFLADRNVLIDQAKDRTFSPMGQALQKIQGKAVKSREVYFALYQALANPVTGENLYEKYPRDFFDLIIVDECHRGSANEEGSWRKILDYFDSATKIGMTATPKRNDNVDTYEYFGEPIYEYSLKQGIDDGFLAPYRVYRVIPDVDASGLQVDAGVLDRFGREIPADLYGTKDFERVVSLLSRTEVVAKHLTEYLKRTNRFDKTIVFCVDQEHALDMRIALNNANADLSKIHLHYVERVVSEEGSVGRGHLDNFQDPEKEVPVILTTSQMLTTGVDAPTCRNVVLFRTINSMTEFKQIIGRGTRVSEEHGKFWFTILDYVGATQLFYDPAFDGDPVRVTKTEIDKDGNETSVEDSEEGTLQPEEDPKGFEKPLGSIGELPRKYYLDNVHVYIAGEQAFELDPNGNVLKTVEFTDYVTQNIRRLNLTAEHLRQVWTQAEQRKEILDQLRARGIDPDHLAHVTHHEEADALDLLLHVAYNAPLVSRRERAEKLRQKKANFFNTFTPAAREILETLLEKYADYGVGEFDQLPRVLQVSPFDRYGSTYEIYQLFGGAEKMLQAVDELQKFLYE
ncbi:MAG: DEAD/DEAH box helicase family protein [Anaerolineales bacterium]|uniref:EcoAI/FtnUII family type I restriction enzme subunit R n=1 Tax=Candidatus Villigracilis vicinus TaxID=3140679 RepID=UPI003134A49F|nr:DEAD/DEAH box helicase family protein [Anaerolineales bacterium]